MNETNNINTEQNIMTESNELEDRITGDDLPEDDILEDSNNQTDNINDVTIPVGEGIIAQVRDTTYQRDLNTSEEIEASTEQEDNSVDNTNSTPTSFVLQNLSGVGVEDNLSRFSGAEWFNIVQKQDVILAGVGGIGSWTGLLLSRLNIHNLYMFDPDTVDGSNMCGQLYRREDINKSKVSALSNIIRSFSRFYRCTEFNTKYISSSPTCNIMICGFDNMEARRVAYFNWKKHITSISKESMPLCLFIDGRMSAEIFQIFAIKGDDFTNMKNYESNYLFDDSKADSTICSYKQTSFCASAIASFIVNLFVNFCTNQCNPLLEREVPFFTEYTADMMYLIQER